MRGIGMHRNKKQLCMRIAHASFHVPPLAAEKRRLIGVDNTPFNPFNIRNEPVRTLRYTLLIG